MGKKKQQSKLAFVKSLARDNNGQPKPTKVERPKKGKGSYLRKNKNKTIE